MNYAEFEYRFYKNKINQLMLQKTFSNDDKLLIQEMIQAVDKEYFPSFYAKINNTELLNNLYKLQNDLNLKSLPSYIPPLKETPTFTQESVDLNDFLEGLKKIEDAKTFKDSVFTNHEVNEVVLQFLTYVLKGQRKNISYIYLLRDMLLPYLAHVRLSKAPACPLMLGRKMMASLCADNINDDFDYGLSDDNHIYNQFISIIFEAYQVSSTDFDKFFAYIKPRFIEMVKKYPRFYNFLQRYLKSIPTRKIIVLESGRFGTIPLILKSLDARVDFRLLATSFEFYDLYRDKIMSYSLNNLVTIEKSVVQNELFIFDKSVDNKVFIKINTDNKVLQLSKLEVADLYNLCNIKNGLSRAHILHTKQNGPENNLERKKFRFNKR